VRLNALHLSNFRQHVDTHIEFDTGLTGIIGPNGAGKSTILEAIAWALYGMPAARGTRESIRSNRAGARAQVRVELDFELGGHTYRVVRGLTNAELYLDGASAPIANSLSGVSELLRRRLGMSLEEFFNTYFTGQKELSVMAAMGPSERAQFLSRVLGYERLRTAQGLVRERRRIIAAEVAGLRAGMPDPEQVSRMVAESEARLSTARARGKSAVERRARARTELDAITPRWETMQRQRDLLQRLQADIRVAEGEEAGFARDRLRLDRELEDILQARADLERITAELRPLGDVVMALQQMELLFREEGRRQTLLESERALAEELTRLRERRNRVESAPTLEGEAAQELAQRRQELEQVQSQLEAARTDWVRDRQEAETKHTALKQQWAEVKRQRDQIVDLGESGTCPTCARPLEDHYRNVLDLLDSQLETIEVDGKYFKARLEQLEQMPAEVRELDDRRKQSQDLAGKLERRLAKVQAAVQELQQLGREIQTKEQRHETLQRELVAIPSGYDPLKHRELRLELDRLQPLDAKAARLSAQLDREPQLRRERERVGAELARVGERLANLRAQRQTIDLSDEAVASLRNEYERATSALREAELSAVAAESEATNAEAAVAVARQAQRDLDKAVTQLDSKMSDKRLHDELDRAYSDMRTDLNLQLRPEISELASAFLTDLTDARYSELELDDQYNIIILEDGIPKPVISGGEEDIANLVLRLAISQMIAERAGQPFSLLVLDEIFGSLDEGRRNNVVDLLRRLQDRFEQVILITHIESVREGLDRVVNVRYDEESGTSRVEQESENGEAMLLPDDRKIEAGAAD
jgi:DNA repair protein SbcC/Rad50